MSGWIAAAVIVAAGATTYEAEQSRSAQKKANAQSLALAKDQAALADKANNKMNAKRPNLAGIAAANAASASGGAGSTMLTGPQGVDPGSLTLGKNTLLGS